VAGNRSRTNSEFLRRVDEYLPADAGVIAVDASEQPEPVASADLLNGNTFYLFSADALLAASHAIEDLALDEANGTLLVVLRNFDHFTAERERYALLAAAIDGVEVVGSGRKPRQCGRIRFIPASQGVLKDFWVVLYQGRHAQALVMSRPARRSNVFENRTFVGFYTFDCRLITRVRQDIERLLRGESLELREYDRMRRIDRTIKEVRAVLRQEQTVLQTTLEKLPFGRVQPRALASRIDSIVQRLQTIKTKLPEIEIRVASPNKK
jgi:hypothetical protein